MADKIVLNVGGEKLIAVLHKGREDADTCIVMCHGLLSGKDSIKYIIFAEKCSELGMNALRFDFHGCGESEGRVGDTTVSKRLEDLNAVIEYLTHELGIKKIGLFGSSLGGFISLLKAGQDPRIKTIVCIASPFSMAELIDPMNLKKGYLELGGIIIEGTFFNDLESNDKKMQDGLSKFKCPVLLFQGDCDILVPIDHVYRINEKLSCEKDLKIIEGAGHLIMDPMHLNYIITNSLEWFGKYLWDVKR